ncbi:hypothetical protein [Desulfogranum mediterraneum]|uniref:hypothetical protein n=1 Tax=Desulfogranum mediterraneum TaxID=160661 RepID=UPI00041F1FFA|nr:hypothetical protein [Desulfogranum mediterraneum]
MHYVINRELKPGCAVITLELQGFGTVKVGNLVISDHQLAQAYQQALEGYASPSQGYPQYYAAEKLVKKFGGEIVRMEIGDEAWA